MNHVEAKKSLMKNKMLLANANENKRSKNYS